MKITIENQETTVEFTGHELRELLVLAALKEAGFSRGQYALDATLVEVLKPSDRRTNALGRYRVRLFTGPTRTDGGDICTDQQETLP